MPFALSLLLAAGQPAIVLTPASPAPPSAVFATRCGAATPQDGGSEVECLVEQPQPGGGEAKPAMRILIRTTPAAAPCGPASAQTVAVPAAETPRRADRLPVVVENARGPACR